MASAAIDRLGRTPDVVDRLSIDQMLPQVGQGSLAIESRVDDEKTKAMLAQIDNALAHRLLNAERAFLVELGGDCDLPAGAYGVIESGDPDGTIDLAAMLSNGDDVVLRDSLSGDDGEAMGNKLAVDLRSRLV